MRSISLSVLLLACTSGAAMAQADSAAFIIRLGDDTTAVERYVRTAERLEAEAVQRSPSTVAHRLVLDLGDDGRVTRALWQVSDPSHGEVMLRRTIAFRGDSAVLETEQRGRTTTRTVAAADAIPLSGPFYSPYEMAIRRAVAGGAAKAEVTLLTGGGTVAIPVERVGEDSVTLTDQFQQPMRARIDAEGRLIGLGTPGYTSVERLAWVDLPALTREFVARDETGRGLGQLSPREAYREQVGEANIWVDYSRPSTRGRPIWGGLVPWGEVWRMGANQAAHLATDRAIELGDLVLEPGTYTLFLLPTQDEWTLIVNHQTGISGLAHDPAHDIGRVALDVEELDEPVEQFEIAVESGEGGGTLAVAWGGKRGTVPLRVR